MVFRLKKILFQEERNRERENHTNQLWCYWNFKLWCCDFSVNVLVGHIKLWLIEPVFLSLSISKIQCNFLPLTLVQRCVRAWVTSMLCLIYIFIIFSNRSLAVNFGLSWQWLNDESLNQTWGRHFIENRLEFYVIIPFFTPFSVLYNVHMSYKIIYQWTECIGNVDRQGFLK